MPAASVDQYLTDLERRLVEDGCTTGKARLRGGHALVSRRADFRLRWFATRLHLFTVAIAFEQVDVPLMEAFTAEAMAHARESKGGLPSGLQTGTAAFAVAVSERVDPQALAWAATQQRTEFAGFGRPVVVDVANRQVATYTGTPVLGASYARHLRAKAATYFPGATAGWAGG